MNIKFLASLALIVAMLVAPAFAANENLFNTSQPTGYSPNPAAMKNVTASYTVLSGDHMVQVTASTAALVMTLPPISTANGGKSYIFKRLDNTGINITITASTTDTVTNYIGGQASRKLTTMQNGYLAITKSAGNNWKVQWETPPIQADMYLGHVSTYVNEFVVLTASTTLTTDYCGKVVSIATDALTMTLPATKAGCIIRFVNSGAAGNNIITIDPNAADNIWGTFTLASSVVVSEGSAGVTIVNTKSSSVKGDSVTLVGDGIDGWFILSSTGIWAEGS